MALLPHGFANPNVPIFFVNEPPRVRTLPTNELIPSLYGARPEIPYSALEIKLTPAPEAAGGGTPYPSMEATLNGEVVIEEWSAASTSWISFQLAPSTSAPDLTIAAAPVPPWTAAVSTLSISPQAAIETPDGYIVLPIGITLGVLMPDRTTPYSIFVTSITAQGDTETIYQLGEGFTITTQRLD